jgi:short-subunit dehydrogenase
MKIENSVIIVTGASSGIGLSSARLLAKKGARVVLAARSMQHLEELSGELPGSLALATDMTHLDAVRAMVAKTVDHYGRVDVLVNNAGRGYEASLEGIEPTIFEEIFRLNVVGPVVAMQAVIPHMRAQRSGAIVNINSGTALMKIPRLSAYSATKRALVGISLTARVELEQDGIVVSQVYPGLTATNFGENRATSGPPRPETQRHDFAGGDSPDYIAELIARAIVEGEAEYFAHERMVEMDNRTLVSHASGV